MALDYPAVTAWLNKEGLLAHLCLAQRRIHPDEARALTVTILGHVPIRVKRTGRSWAYSHNESVTLSCDDRRTVSLMAVLHECAHILDYRKGRKMGHSHHGEPFRRTYARLLKEHAI